MELKVRTTKFGNRKVTCDEYPNLEAIYQKIDGVFVLRYNAIYHEFLRASEILIYIARKLEKRKINDNKKRAYNTKISRSDRESFRREQHEMDANNP